MSNLSAELIIITTSLNKYSLLLVPRRYLRVCTNYIIYISFNAVYSRSVVICTVYMKERWLNVFSIKNWLLDWSIEWKLSAYWRLSFFIVFVNYHFKIFYFIKKEVKEWRKKLKWNKFFSFAKLLKLTFSIHEWVAKSFDNFVR